MFDNVVVDFVDIALAYHFDNKVDVVVVAAAAVVVVVVARHNCGHRSCVVMLVA